MLEVLKTKVTVVLPVWSILLLIEEALLFGISEETSVSEFGFVNKSIL